MCTDRNTNSLFSGWDGIVVAYFSEGFGEGKGNSKSDETNHGEVGLSMYLSPNTRTKVKTETAKTAKKSMVKESFFSLVSRANFGGVCLCLSHRRGSLQYVANIKRHAMATHGE